jgi:hypothetical protein
MTFEKRRNYTFRVRSFFVRLGDSRKEGRKEGGDTGTMKNGRVPGNACRTIKKEQNLPVH